MPTHNKSVQYEPRNGNEHYEKAMINLIKLKPRNLSIECPECGENGVVTSKWIKGIRPSPVVVLHSDNGGPHTECFMNKDDADDFRGSLKLYKPDIRRMLKNTKGFVLFSGGLDSVCTLHYLMQIVGDNKSDLTALHVDTTAGFPEVTKYVKTICRKLGVRLKIVSPKRDYFDLAKRWGIPSHNSRWCCKELKVNPIRNYLKTIDGDVIIYDGIRAAESNQRSTYLPVWFHPTLKCISVSPIIHWEDKDTQKYFHSTGLPKSPAFDLGCSAECWCGAYKNRSDFEKLLEVHPEIFAKLVEVEKAQRGTFTFIYENGKKVPLKSLIK